MTAVAALPALEEPHPLAPEQVDAFRRDGHVLVPGLASPEEVAAFRDPIVEAARRHAWDRRPLEERDAYGRAFDQAFNLWRRHEGIARFTLSPRFAAVAAQLLGADRLRLYHDQALVKDAGGGGTPWHQDQTYWPFEPGPFGAITMWMPLDDVPAEVGTLRFASGTHRLGDLSGGAIGEGSEAHFDRLLSEREIPVHTYGPMRAGDATFHAGWTLHGAPANPTARRRPVMTVIWFADGLRVVAPSSPEQQHDLDAWLGGGPVGAPAGGPRNPVLFPAGG